MKTIRRHRTLRLERLVETLGPILLGLAFAFLAIAIADADFALQLGR